MPRAVLRSDDDRPAPWGVQHLVAERVQRPGDPGAHPPRPEHPAVVGGSGATADAETPAHFVVSAQ